MLIEIYLFEGRFFVRNEVKMRAETGKFYVVSSGMAVTFTFKEILPKVTR